MTYGYIRVSTDKQTVENQRFEIGNFCRKENLEIDGWIEETISGTKNYDKRKLGDLLNHVQSGDLIICAELDALKLSKDFFVKIIICCNLNRIYFEKILSFAIRHFEQRKKINNEENIKDGQIVFLSAIVNQSQQVIQQVHAADFLFQVCASVNIQRERDVFVSENF